MQGKLSTGKGEVRSGGRGFPPASSMRFARGGERGRHLGCCRRVQNRESSASSKKEPRTSFGGGVGAAVASTGAGGGGSLLGAGCLCCPTASPASFVPGPLVGAVLPAAAGGGGGASGDELPQPISKISIWLAEECRLPVAKYTRVPECNHSLSVYNVSVRIRKWRFFRSILVAGRRSPALSWLHATPANAATPKPPGWVSSDRLDCI